MNAIRTGFVWSVLALAASTAALAADRASGTISFQGHAGAIKHAWMVRGPDEMDAARTVLRIYLSSADIGTKIKACKTLSCADNALEDGAMVDYGDARHLAYAVRLDGERVQYSGGTGADAFALSTNKPDHLAGKLHIDDSAAGGAKVDADFDLGLANTFTSVR
jgi:opacity protein-like surface antigen